MSRTTDDRDAAATDRYVGEMHPSSAPLTLVELSDMMLGVELKAKLGDKVDLGFKEIDMMLLVVHQLLRCKSVRW